MSFITMGDSTFVVTGSLSFLQSICVWLPGTGRIIAGFELDLERKDNIRSWASARGLCERFGLAQVGQNDDQFGGVTNAKFLSSLGASPELSRPPEPQLEVQYTVVSTASSLRSVLTMPILL